MRSISIELVPRDYDELAKEISIIRQKFGEQKSGKIDTLNIPDLLNCPIRSWDACMSKGVGNFDTVIPHIKAIDFDLRQPFELGNTLMKAGINNVLVVTGDKPHDPNKKVYRNTSIELIRLLKSEFGGMKVYAAIDPYRSSLRDELIYINDKIEAGADGFFTQPFFDTRLLDLYMEHLAGINVYWGISPVVTEKSQHYWEKRNNVVFPKGFKPDMESNIKLAQDIMAKAEEHGSSVYFMPIKVDPVEYLRAVFAINK